MLSRLSLMVQAAVLDGQFLDHFSPFDDGCVAPEVQGFARVAYDYTMAAFMTR
jgi:hypothetical protein